MVPAKFFQSIFLDFAGVILLLGLSATAAFAQTAALRGKITDAQTGEPLPRANVVVTGTNFTGGAASNNDGFFEVRNLAAGVYSVSVSFMGYEKQTLERVALNAGESRELNLALHAMDIPLNPVVVSASRLQEKALEAPAAVAIVEAEQVQRRSALTATDHLRSLTGVDIATTGLAQSNVVVRGFNSMFSSNLLVLTDNRNANVPSLRVNDYSLIPIADDDLSRIEVVSGPGSALYGPNCANGVLHLITASPFESRGTTISVGGGGRDFFNLSSRGPGGGHNVYTAALRHAGTWGEKWGYKISAQYHQGRDWESYLPIDVAPRQIIFGYQTTTGKMTVGDSVVNSADFGVKKIAGDARLDLRLNQNTSLIFNAGVNRGNHIGLTTVGAFQVKGWTYSYAQARLNYKNLFVQGFINASDAGNTFGLRTGNYTLDNSKLIVGQAQHALAFGHRQRFTYGADAQFTIPDTKNTIHGRNEDTDNITELGIYLQSETRLSSSFDLVLAARLDEHNHLEPQFSPRAALVFKPSVEHNFRLTYNRAFRTPTPATFFVDILAESVPNPLNPAKPLIAIRAYETPGPMMFRRGGDGRAQMMTQLLPPGTGYVPSTVNSVWPALRQILVLGSPAALQALLAATLPQELGATVPGDFRKLNTATGGFDLVADVHDRPALAPEINNTFEIGYKGVLGEKLVVGMDVYHTRYKDFISELQVFNPNVFANPQQLAVALQPTAEAITNILIAQGVPPEQAQAQAQAIVTGLVTAAAQLPLGVVSPEPIANDTDVILTNRNFGDISVNGLDLSLTYYAHPRWTFSGNYSFVTDKGFNIFKRPNRVYFENVDGVDDIALNAPANKAALSVQYRNRAKSFEAELRGRYVEGFPMKSGVYEGEVQTYTIVDANLSYELPFAKDTRLAFSALNLFDKEHCEFIGAPVLGRLLLAKLTQRF
ncbi:MAG: TonB-dependent receptor [candidate division KSB1 bacterium]|nr:TonB-dependent receptor [candidate division KSB1 bacterium]